MTDHKQLTLDGREEPAGLRSGALSPAQHELLRALAVGELTSSEAGRIIHLARRPSCYFCRQPGNCPWVAGDGGDAMKRLAERGYCERRERGVWVSTVKSQETLP